MVPEIIWLIRCCGCKTGNTLFRVHQSFFERESEVFRGLFVRAAEDDPPSGTDAYPFTLDVTASEFAQLLWVWYDCRQVSSERCRANRFNFLIGQGLRPWAFLQRRGFRFMTSTV